MYLQIVHCTEHLLYICKLYLIKSKIANERERKDNIVLQLYIILCLACLSSLCCVLTNKMRQVGGLLVLKSRISLKWSLSSLFLFLSFVLL